MSESGEPGSQACFAHSPCRGLAARRAAAALLLGGSAGLPCETVPALGAATSPPLMCARCSSVALGRLWHAAIATVAMVLANRARNLMIDSLWEDAGSRELPGGSPKSCNGSPARTTRSRRDLTVSDRPFVEALSAKRSRALAPD